MGDRANICVRENSSDGGVFIYSHWSGSELPDALQVALKKRWRWDDFAYLTRIIFDTVTDGNHGQETGFGLSTMIGDGEDRLLTVDVESQTVRRESDGELWTFEAYIASNVGWE